MNRRISLSLVSIIFCLTSVTLLAQEEAAVAKTATYDLKKNVKCRVAATPEGALVVFETGGAANTERRKYAPIRIIKEYGVSARDNSVLEVRVPRDLASGQASGREQQKVEEIAESSGVASATSDVSKVSIQDFHYVVSNKDTKRELTTTNGECDLPIDLPDGSYNMNASWSWGTSQSAGTSSGGMSGGRTLGQRCSVDFLLEIKDGNFVAINQKGLPGDKRPVKANK